jgi:hypothetical protein
MVARSPSKTKKAAVASKKRLLARQKRILEAKRVALVEAKRGHRADLSARAMAHWKMQGARARRAYMERVRTALEMEGFESTPFQWRHKGHAYGLIKDLGDKQIHVRVYDDGVIDAEIEIHKRYLEHLWSPRPSAHRQVLRIFRKHAIPIHFVNEKYIPQVGATRSRYPKMRTRVSHLIAGAAGTVGVAGIYVAKLYLDRVRTRRG